MTSRWSNPTGGLEYHLRGLYRRTRTWAPFTQRLARWLAQWSPPEQELVLVGPSGGYCLDLPFLARFPRLVAVDIDPFAPFFFRRRVASLLREKRCALAWDAQDYLSPGPAGFTHEGLRALLAKHPGAAVLFCNLLGQLPLLGEDRDPEQRDDAPPEGSFESWLSSLPEVLAGRSWATFHDRLSGRLEPVDLDAEEPQPWCSSEELVEKHYRPPEHGELDLVDHRTSGLLPEAPRWRFCWELVPGLFHLLEALRFRSDLG